MSLCQKDQNATKPRCKPASDYHILQKGGRNHQVILKGHLLTIMPASLGLARTDIALPKDNAWTRELPSDTTLGAHGQKMPGRHGKGISIISTGCECH